MKNVIIYNKEIGETPLECLERARIENNISKDISMTYAGRLDPMACGLLLILVGDECKKKEKYTGLDKEYEIEILFGIKTDSQDILGLIEDVKILPINIDKIDFKTYIGKSMQKYPRYSSKIIAMKELPEEMPSRTIDIYSIEKLNESKMKGNEVAEYAIKNIKKVKGDFRQVKIIKNWQDFALKYPRDEFKIIRLKVECGSGTYMRVLADRIGKDIGIGAIALSIKRTKIC